MKIIFNQKEIDIEKDISILSFLEKQNLKDEHIAIAINQTIIKKEKWETTFLKDGDKILIIGAVRGG